MAERLSLDALPGAFGQALAQMPSGKFLGIALLALVLTLVLTGPFLLVVVGLAALVDVIPLPAVLQSDTAGSWVGWSSGLFWTYVMSPLAVAIVSLLLEPIVEAVETRHYAHLPKIRRRGIGEAVVYAIRFLGLMLAVSLVASLIAWLTPIPGRLVFTLATAYLLAREYTETVALRRLPATEAKADVARNLVPLWAAGLIVALALNVPVLNLIAPILGVAAFTHLFHGRRRSLT